MPNLAVALREEITRLARREISAKTESMKKAVTQYRREIAQLKRTVNGQEKRIAFLEREERKRLGKPAANEVPEKTRFSVRSVKAQRKRLGLSAEDFGRLVGVTGQSVYNWERGVSRPKKQQMAALVGLRSLGKRETAERLEMLEKR